MLDMKRLRLLWELRKRGTITAVAAALNYSPGAVSQQLSILESEAGTPLLRKSGRTLEFTASGEALVAEVEELLAGLERAEAALHRTGAEVTGTIRVTMFQTAMLAIVPGMLQRLRDDVPLLRVEVTHLEPGAALQDTWARGYDLVMAEEYPGHAREHFPGLDREPLLKDRIRLGLPNLGAGDSRFEKVRSLKDLADLPWVMEPPGTETRHWAEQACRLAGFEPDVRYVTADMQSHLRLVESGHAVALLPGLAFVGASRRMRFLDLPGAPSRSIFTAARSSMAGHPALLAVRAALAAEVAELRVI